MDARNGTLSNPGLVENEGLRVVEVRGSDARSWLNDLATGPVGSLHRGEATRSLLLTPTGRIRADFTVADPAGGVGPALTLLQGGDQPDYVADLLTPYVLSSDVELVDVSERLVAFSLHGAEQSVERSPEGASGLPVAARSFSPSILGPGVGLLVERENAEALAASLPSVRGEDLERWRIELGIPRFGADFEVGSLPAEAALESAIDFTKGCFLGQESIAKVRNLGHPQTRLVALRSDGTVARGDAVYADRSEVGTVTSAAVPDSGTILLARVRWEAADKELSTRDGGPLLRRSVSGT